MQAIHQQTNTLMRQSFKTLLACLPWPRYAPPMPTYSWATYSKKAKQALETVTGTEQTTTGNAAAGAATVAIPSGGTMQNPLAQAADIELVGAYGKSTSENYGTVYLVLRVKMKANKSRIGFGGSINNEKTMAVDQDGNAYITGTLGQYFKDVTEGIAVKVTLDDQYGVFTDVKKTAKVMQVIKLGCFVDQTNKGMITFKDVPVLWDVAPQ